MKTLQWTPAGGGKLIVVDDGKKAPGRVAAAPEPKQKPARQTPKAGKEK